MTSTFTPTSTGIPTNTFTPTLTYTPVVVAEIVINPAVLATIQVPASCTGGGLSISIPAGSFGASIPMTVSQYSVLNAPSPQSAPPSFTFLGAVYQINTGGVEPAAGSSVTLTFPYPNSVNPNFLSIAYYDTTTGWVNYTVGGAAPHALIVNTFNQTVSVVTDHFSFWALGTVSGSQSTAAAGCPTLLLSANKFNSVSGPALTLNYCVAQQGTVNIMVYNVSGLIVRHLVNETDGANGYSALWDGKDDNGQTVTTGLYLIFYREPSRTDIKKVLVIQQ
jgi:hypothetical protein